MRIVIFTVKDHLYANLIIKELISMKDIKISAIVESNVIYPGRTNISALLKYLKISGLSYVSLQVLKVWYFIFARFLVGLLNKKSHIFYDYKKFARQKNIPIYRVNDINDSNFIKRLSIKNSDLFVSVLFNQIFKRELLKIPKLGTINIHPALLPSFKGVSPTFWVLALNKKKTGVSIHTIPDEKVDEGMLLEQKEISISKNDTEHSLYLKCIYAGIPLLKKTIQNINKGVKYTNLKRGKSSYYSIPTKEAVDRFKKLKRRFYTFNELLIRN